MTLSLSRAQDVLRYDPATGVFTWRADVGQRGRAGGVAGYINPEGYWHVQIDGKKHLGHRLAWLLMTGDWPKYGVDHRDLNKANNKWGNLRAATQLQNMANQKARRHNGTGLKGVSLRKNGRFQAQICVGGVNHYLGVFTTAHEAHCAYSETAVRLNGEFARTL